MTGDAGESEIGIATAVDRYLDTVQVGDESGNYYRNANRLLTQVWLPWAKTQGVEHPSDIDKQVMLKWAERLKQRVDRRRSDDEAKDGISPATADTYHTYVRAFVTFCIERGLHPAAPAQNPAALDVVTDLIPSREKKQTQQQYWDDEARIQLLRYVDERAHDAADEQGLDAYQEFRDRALVYVLAFTGVRIGEVLRASNDDRRDGLTWDGITEDPPTLVVLGKSQEIEESPLPSQAKSTLDRLRRVARPPSDDWPVFMTTHAPTLYGLARDHLPDYDYSESDIDDLCSQDNRAALLDALREHNIKPPAVSTNGGRSRLKTLCERAGLDVDDDHGYLTPHGGRRGVGSTLYFNNPAKAQKALRHSSIEITEQAYSHLDTGELGEDMSELLEPESGSQPSEETDPE